MIIEHKGQKNKLKNLNTGEELKRLYTDEELDQTFMIPEKKVQLIKKQIEKPILKPEETIAKGREKRVRKVSDSLNLQNLLSHYRSGLCNTKYSFWDPRAI
jgi:hypothetical protein